MNQKRNQLTLFIDEDDASNIELIRRTFNPLQHKLIKAHVTLCREDELIPIEKVLENLSLLKNKYVTINFGEQIRFAEEKGVLLPATESSDFDNLRKLVLSGINNEPQKHKAHITLMHPRNATCTDKIFEQISGFNLPGKIVFKKISLIEQYEEDEWQVLKEFALLP